VLKPFLVQGSGLACAADASARDGIIAEATVTAGVRTYFTSCAKCCGLAVTDRLDLALII